MDGATPRFSFRTIHQKGGYVPSAWGAAAWRPVARRVRKKHGTRDGSLENSGTEHTNLSPNGGVNGTVDVAEMMGSSVHLHITAEGRDVIIIVPTTDMEERLNMGDTVRFTFKGNVAHVFSKETDKNLEF